MCLCKSIVGDDQTATPEGPQSCAPFLFLRTGFGSSAMVYCFHKTLPVVASKEDTLPRNLQHSYLGSAPATSSKEETGTYKRPPARVGEPVMTAAGCSSSFVFQTSLPVAASTAYTLARMSPKYATHRFPIWPMLIAV